MTSFSDLNDAVPDAAFQLIQSCKADTSPVKVDLSPGFYRDESADPWVLPCVKKAKQILASDPDANHEHSPISGHPQFLNAARDILFDGTEEENSRIASFQTIAGTGANHLGALLITQAKRPAAVWISNPSWINHQEIWKLASDNIEIRNYPYFDAENFTVDFEATLLTLRSEAREGDAVILHACAHNPTGIDFTKDQWKVLAELCSEKNLTPLFDIAYQGFATGDLDEDAWPVRHFTRSTSLEILVAQSFSKNFGLYGERIGALHVVCGSADSRSKVISLLSKLSRAELTTCPINGANIVATVLGDATLRQQWLRDLAHMSDRISSMRKRFVEGLHSLKTPGSWDHIVTDIGMFSMTGLNPEQVRALRENYHVYMLPSGRISFTGLTDHNVDHVVQSIHEVVLGTA